jgi:hypothetical protein
MVRRTGPSFAVPRASRSRMFRRLAPWLVLCAGLGAGCSDDSPGPFTIAVTKTNLCPQMAKIACRNMFECCTGAQLEKVLGITISTNESQCQRDMQLKCEEQNAQLLYAINKGTVTLHEDLITACYQSLYVGTNGCFYTASEQPWKTTCSTDDVVLYEGVQESNSECTFTIECKTDNKCGQDRKCKALPKAGETCSNGACAKDYYCSSKDGKCAARKNSGEACDSTSDCAKKLFCEKSSTSGGSGTCSALKDVGASCTANNACSSSYCIPGVCSNNHTCYKDADCTGTCKTTTTQSCNKDSECPGKCQSSGDSCNADGQCGGTTGSCVHETCEQKCTGSPVCGYNYQVVDYCQDPSSYFFGVATP